MEQKVKASFKECMDCQTRQTGCHSHCKAYLAAKHAREQENAARQKEAQETAEHIAVRYKHLKTPLKGGQA